MDFDQILHMHWYWIHLAWDCLVSIFIHSLQSYSHWMTSKFCFHSISWVWINGFWPNFAHALILTISSLGLLCIHFRQFITELRPLNDIRIDFKKSHQQSYTICKGGPFLKEANFCPKCRYSFLKCTSCKACVSEICPMWGVLVSYAYCDVSFVLYVV